MEAKKILIVDEAGHTADSTRRLISGQASMLALKAVERGLTDEQILADAKEIAALRSRAEAVGPKLGTESRAAGKARRLVFQPRSEQRLRSLRGGEENTLQASDGTRYFADQSGAIRKIVSVGAAGKVEHNKGRIRRQRKAAARG